MAADETARINGTALAATTALAIVTMAAAARTGASTMLAATIQALVAASSLALLQVGMKRAERPADAAHPFGYAKDLTFWSFVVAILLFAFGGGILLREGIARLGDPQPISAPTNNFAALAAGLGLALFASMQALSELKRRRATGAASLRDLKDPALSSIVIQTTAGAAGIVVAAAGLGLVQLTSALAIDACATILIGLLLAAVAAKLSVELRALIIGEAASPAVMHDIRAAIAAERGIERPVIAINEIRTLQLGPRDILVAASVDFEDDTPAAEIEAAGSRIEAAVRARHPEVRRFYLEGQSAREFAEAARLVPAVNEARPEPAARPASPSVAPLVSQPPPVSNSPQTAKPAQPSPSLPPRESRKGRKRNKGKGR